ncbi:hypothetical protein [Streptomyces akebiae]|nr:hypothetical protein [Streptomyces akebiae]
MRAAIKDVVPLMIAAISLVFMGAFRVPGPGPARSRAGGRLGP